MAAERSFTNSEAVELPVDELALWLLQRVAPGRPGGGTNRHNLLLGSSWQSSPTEAEPPEEFMLVIAEAFDWLLAHGLIAEMPTNMGGFAGGGTFFRTRLGEAVLEAHNPVEHVRASQQLVVSLHPRIEARVRRQFLLGEHETAVFIPLREVEIRVRELSGAGEDVHGVSLMRFAFKPDPPGPLADEALPTSERQATMELFSGAYGVFRNPSGHREVQYGDPAMVARIVLLADLLLHTLDRIAERVANGRS